VLEINNIKFRPLHDDHGITHMNFMELLSYRVRNTFPE
jgi:hypothetical protein